MRIQHVISSSILFIGVLSVCQAGIFAPPAGQSGSTAVDATDGSIEGWATGYQDYQPGVEVDTAFQTPEKALGVPGNSDGNTDGFTFDIVSLGRNGSITLMFSPPIKDGPGSDFAVFENSFSDSFLEFAKVEVSTDGINFVGFPAFSLVPATVSSFGAIDATDVEQLAGKYRAGFGTPFDLAQLSGAPSLDLSEIRYVRLLDVVGDGTAPNELTAQALADWLGLALNELPQALIDIAASAPSVVYDPYPTFDTAGFDLDAVGVIQQGVIPASVAVNPFGGGSVDPEATVAVPVVLYSMSLAGGDLDELDATDIDIATVRFGVNEAVPLGAPVEVDLDGDGLTDAGFMFQTQDTGIACEDSSVLLVGVTNDGHDFDADALIATPDCPTCHP